MLRGKLNSQLLIGWRIVKMFIAKAFKLLLCLLFVEVRVFQDCEETKGRIFLVSDETKSNIQEEENNIIKASSIF